MKITACLQEEAEDGEWTERQWEKRARGKVRTVRLQVILFKVKHSDNRYYVSNKPLEVAVYSGMTTARCCYADEIVLHHGISWNHGSQLFIDIAYAVCLFDF